MQNFFFCAVVLQSLFSCLKFVILWRNDLTRSMQLFTPPQNSMCIPTSTNHLRGIPQSQISATGSSPTVLTKNTSAMSSQRVSYFEVECNSEGSRCKMKDDIQPRRRGNHEEELRKHISAFSVSLISRETKENKHRRKKPEL